LVADISADRKCLSKKVTEDKYS